MRVIRKYIFISEDFKIFDGIPIKLHENYVRDLELGSVGSIFFQTIGTKTITVILGDAKEVFLKYLIAFTPAVLITGALEFCTALGTGLYLGCNLHFSGSG